MQHLICETAQIWRHRTFHSIPSTATSAITWLTYFC